MVVRIDREFGRIFRDDMVVVPKTEYSFYLQSLVDNLVLAKPR